MEDHGYWYITDMVRTRVEKTSVGLLGDVFVVLMIIVQMLATAFFIFIALSGFD